MSDPEFDVVNAGDQFIEAPSWYTGHNRWINWHGFECEVGGTYAPRYLNDISHRINEIMLNITCVVGIGGLGKTYFALKLSQILDKKFKVENQVVFNSTQFLQLIDSGKVGPGSCIIIDESQWSMSNRDWADKENKEYMKIFQAIRSRGYCIFIIALNEAIIDNIARGYCLTHKITMLSRGMGRTAKYVTREGKKELITEALDDEFYLSLPDDDKCAWKSCLVCPYSGVRQQDWARREEWDKLYGPDGPCETIRAVYERMKLEFIEGRNKASIVNRTKPSKPSQEALQLCVLKREDGFRLTDKRRYDLDSIAIGVEDELHYKLSTREKTSLRMWLESEHPEKWRAKKEATCKSKIMEVKKIEE